MGIVQFLRFSVFSGFSDFWSRPKKKRIPKKKRLKGTPGIYIIHQMLNLGHVVTKYHHTSIVLAISKPTRANGLQSKASHLFLTLPAV